MSIAAAKRCIREFRTSVLMRYLAERSILIVCQIQPLEVCNAFFLHHPQKSRKQRQQACKEDFLQCVFKSEKKSEVKFGSYSTLFSNARTVETQLSGISIQSFATNVLILYRRSRRQQKKLDHVFQQDISNCAAPGNYEGKGLFSNKSQHIFTLLHRFLIFSYFFALKSYPCKFYELIEFRSNKVDFRVFKWQFNV